MLVRQVFKERIIQKWSDFLEGEKDIHELNFSNPLISRKKMQKEIQQCNILLY